MGHTALLQIYGGASPESLRGSYATVFCTCHTEWRFSTDTSSWVWSLMLWNWWKKSIWTHGAKYACLDLYNALEFSFFVVCVLYKMMCKTVGAYRVYMYNVNNTCVGNYWPGLLLLCRLATLLAMLCLV